MDTDYQQIEAWLQKNKINYVMCVPKANPPIKFRVDTVNDALMDMENVPHLKVHKECKELIRDFSKQPTTIDAKGRLIPDKDSDDRLGHAGDACGYHLQWIRPLRKVKFKPRRQLIAKGRR